jgi:lipoprotein NlpD
VSHQVTAGETLYAIALRYDKDYRELARINKLDSAFTIHPGQRLRLAEPASAVVKVAPPAHPGKRNGRMPKSEAPAATGATPVVKKIASVQEKTSASTAASSASASLAWVWPVKGAVISGFGVVGISGKGLDIAGARGDSVRAAAAGTVVYAGAGLVGYGRMLILRHDDNFISAYANNDRFLVKEGDRVTMGQAIAILGSSGTDRVKLHFEIRESGRPVDPLRFLPLR